jgi:hypothetical protein
MGMGVKSCVFSTQTAMMDIIGGGEESQQDGDKLKGDGMNKTPSFR